MFRPTKRIALAALMVAFCLACGDDDGTPGTPPTIDSLRDETGDGIAVIGENVTLVGVFGESVRVTIDGIDAPIVATGDPAGITVRVPAAVGVGAVAVVAANSHGAGAAASLSVRRLAYSADFADRAVSVLEIDGLEVTPLGHVEVDVAPGPFAIAFTPDGRTAVIACGVGFLPDDIVAALAPGSPPGDSVAIVDVIAGETVAVIKVGDDSKPTGVAVHPDGTTAYVTNFAASTLSVIDLTARVLVENITVPRQPEEVAVRTDGAVLLVNSVGGTVTTIDTESLEILATIETGGNDPSGVAWSADGLAGFVAHSFTDPSLEEDGTVTVLDLSEPAAPSVAQTIARDIGPTSYDVDVASGSGLLLVTNLNVSFSPISIGPGSISLVDLNTTGPTALVQVLPVGSAPIHAAITSDGRVALVGNGLEQTVSVVDLETRAVVDTVGLDSTIGPSDVAIQP